MRTSKASVAFAIILCTMLFTLLFGLFLYASVYFYREIASHYAVQNSQNQEQDLETNNNSTK